MDALLRDIRYSLRQFRRVPLLVTTIVGTLTLVIGANTLLFAIANAALFRALPYPNPSRLLSITIAQKGADVRRMDEPTARLALTANLAVFDSLAMYNSAAATVVGSDYPERVPGATVSAAFFEVLGVRPVQGRTFADDELRAGGPAVIVVSDLLWTRTFGARPTIVGETVTLDDRSYRVVGVMPSGFQYPGVSEYWLPMRPRTTTGGLYFIDFIARLAPAASVEQARAALGTLREARKQELPAAALRSEIRVMSLHERLYGDFTQPIILLLGIVGCVLLIGCANVANLLLARGAARRTEVALRLALGASRRQVIRQLLVESLVLAAVGALAGIAVASLGLRAFRAFGPPALARLATLEIDYQVLLFTLVLTGGTALLFGLAPAFSAARADIDEGLRGSRGNSGNTRSRPSRALVTFELAAAVVLMLGTALLAKSFARFQAIDSGFDADNVLTASITLSTVRYPEVDSRRAFFDGLVERLRALPGVESVSASQIGLTGISMTLEWPPQSERRGDPWELAVSDGVGVGHFRTFGIPILEGRECASDADGSGVVINAAMARRAYGDRSPLGEQLNLSPVSLGTRAVLGVAADVPDIGSKKPPMPTVLACAGRERAAFATIGVRAVSTMPAAELAPMLRAAVRELDPGQPVTRVTTVDQTVRTSVSTRWFEAAVIGGLSTLALLLALGGLYAVTAHSVTARTREIGVRMALGADRRSVMALVFRQSGAMIAVGTALGVIAAIPLVRFVTALLFEVQPLDPAVFGSVAVLVAAVAILATFIPARHASTVDPMVTLRAE